MIEGVIAYDRIRRAALDDIDLVLRRFLPGGRRESGEYIALNPTRADRHLGSFRINLRTGAWADFATSDRGGDLISLVAYLERLTQAGAAINLARMLGVRPTA